MTRPSFDSIGTGAAGRASMPPSSKEVEEVLRPIRRVMAALMRSDALSRGDVDDALRQVTEVASHVLAVARASVWVLEDEGGRIACVDLYDSRTGTHQSGATIPAVDAPAYFASLREARSIAAHDARTDPRTCEFASAYLPQHGIASMLDAPVLVRGQLAGIVCHEHCGEPRRWEFWEELVAGTLADFVAMVLGAAEHVQQAQELARYRAGLEELVELRTAALRRAEQDLRTAFDASPIAMLVTRADDHAVLAANARAAELFEVPLEELEGVRSTAFWVDMDERNKAVEHLAAEGRLEGFVARFRTATGRELLGELNIRVIERGGARCFLAGVRDVTAQRQAEEALLQSRDTLRTLFESAPLPMVLTSVADGRIRQCNERAAAMLELPMEAVVGADVRDFYYDPETRSAVVERLREAGRVDALSIQLKAGTAKPFWVLMSARLISVDGDPGFFVGFADMTAQKTLEEQLRRLASTDGLTGAMNRRSFDEVLAAEVARSTRYGHPLSVAMIDADHFKRLNDRFGHAVGDDALRMLRRVLQASLRRVDVLARYGGEEFVVLLPETDLPAATTVLERVRAAVEAEPSVAPEGGATLTVSIGATAFRPEETVAELVERADAALYEAKQAGRNRLRTK